MTDKLSDLIDEMVRQKTFSFDVLEAVRGLRERPVAQDAQIEKLHKANRSVTVGEAARWWLTMRFARLDRVSPPEFVA